jgi:transposase
LRQLILLLSHLSKGLPGFPLIDARTTAVGAFAQWRLLADLKIPTFDGHLNQSNTDLRRCSMECKPRRKLTREFKLEAVRQAALSEKPKAQLARELGVRVGQLRTWRLEFEKEAVTGIAKPDRSAAEDFEQLRRENAKLKMEIEILKKAAIYFAREAK